MLTAAAASKLPIQNLFCQQKPKDRLKDNQGNSDRVKIRMCKLPVFTFARYFLNISSYNMLIKQYWRTQCFTRKIKGSVLNTYEMLAIFRLNPDKNLSVSSILIFSRRASSLRVEHTNLFLGCQSPIRWSSRANIFILNPKDEARKSCIELF